MCSPIRIALLTGRNHHFNNMGGVPENATAFPGNTAWRPNNIAPLAEMMRLNGYNTAAFGKAHETPAWEVSVAGGSVKLTVPGLLAVAGQAAAQQVLPYLDCHAKGKVGYTCKDSDAARSNTRRKTQREEQHHE